MKRKYPTWVAIAWASIISILLFFTFIVLESNAKLEYENEQLKQENLELTQNLTLCFEGFGGCYQDLTSCIAKKYNITESQLELILNLTEKVK